MLVSLVVAREKPIKYRSTWISVIVGMTFASLASLFLRFVYIGENKRRDRLAAAEARGGSDPLFQEGEQTSPANLPPAELSETPGIYVDMTEKESWGFRYIY